MAQIELKGLSKSYKTGKVLDNLSLSAEQGEIVCVFGPSGVGKTVLLRLIAGVEESDAGSIFLEGRDMTEAPPEARGVGIAFQNFALFPHMTAYDNIGSALTAHGASAATIKQKVDKVAGLLKIGHVLSQGRVTLKRYVAEQHVAIAQRGQARETLDSALAQAGVARHTVLSVPSAYGALMAAAQSDLVACAPEGLARGVGPGLGLVIFKLPLALPAEQVVQAWHPRADADPAHRCLRACVAALSKRSGAVGLAARGLPGPAAARHRDLLALAGAAPPTSSRSRA